MAISNSGISHWSADEGQIGLLQVVTRIGRDDDDDDELMMMMMMMMLLMMRMMMITMLMMVLKIHDCDVG